MGAVYLVRHVNTDERLALKVLHATVLANAMAVERFRREARAPAQIDSDHVVRVTDADTAPELNGAPFLVMEFLKGQDLEHEVEHGALPPDRVILYLKQTARALDKAHSLGIVHRDLKPENLFLAQRDDGTPCIKILDFGIAENHGWLRAVASRQREDRDRDNHRDAHVHVARADHGSQFGGHRRDGHLGARPHRASTPHRRAVLDRGDASDAGRADRVRTARGAKRARRLVWARVRCVVCEVLRAQSSPAIEPRAKQSRASSMPSVSGMRHALPTALRLHRARADRAADSPVSSRGLAPGRVGLHGGRVSAGAPSSRRRSVVHSLAGSLPPWSSPVWRRVSRGTSGPTRKARRAASSAHRKPRRWLRVARPHRRPPRRRPQALQRTQRRR